MTEQADAASPAGGVVDAHQHIWDLCAHAQPWLELPGHEPLLRNFSEADLRPLAAAAGVTATVVVQTVTEASETPELLAIAAASDLIGGVVGWTDLESPAVADALAALGEEPGGGALVGIRHPVLIETDPRWLMRPAVLSGLSAVGAAGLCYDIVVPADLLPVAAETVAACQDVVFVLDHLGNPRVDQRAEGQPDPAWMSSIRRIAAMPNTVCKLSGILGEPRPGRPASDARQPPGEAAGSRSVAHLVPYYETVLSCFGPERLMFGSDWPPCTLSASYAGVVDAARALTGSLSQGERAAIFSETARRVYRLK
ncbi:MAG: amidohydrolase family protein [Nocardiopsaceae bacterium]|jgi:L-fuconolactonase|nr:amidohydrolase family protein [Nocardiopsaceae bacterium]